MSLTQFDVQIFLLVEKKGNKASNTMTKTGANLMLQRLYSYD
jgi:hypothetical protein